MFLEDGRTCFPGFIPFSSHDWEPEDTSVREIFDGFAADLDAPDSAETTITAEAIEASEFADEENWE